jgi:hypothetical protein
MEGDVAHERVTYQGSVLKGGMIRLYHSNDDKTRQRLPFWGNPCTQVIGWRRVISDCDDLEPQFSNSCVCWFL